MATVDTNRQRRTERINVRVEPGVDSLLRRAAAIKHKSLSAFILDSAVESAEAIVKKEQRLVLEAAEFARVMDQLDRPSQVVAPLARLAERVAQRATAPSVVDAAETAQHAV